MGIYIYIYLCIFCYVFIFHFLYSVYIHTRYKWDKTYQVQDPVQHKKVALRQSSYSIVFISVSIMAGPNEYNLYSLGLAIILTEIGI